MSRAIRSVTRPQARRPQAAARERGQVIVVMAFFMVALLTLVAVLIDLIQVRQAQVQIDSAAQVAAVDGARINLDSSTLIPAPLICPLGNNCASRTLKIPDSEHTLQAVRASLERNLASVEFLMEGATPKSVAQEAEIKVVNPSPGACVPSPFDDGAGRGNCYYDPFIAVRVTVPLKTLWGAATAKYQVVVAGALTDNPMDQRPPTPIPTSTPVPYPTFALPRPTCDPRICS